MSKYYNKYIKYKNKYLNLINQIGGGPLIGCNNNVSFTNYTGSCWNVTIQTILLFGDQTSHDVQTKLHTIESKDLIESSLSKLKDLLKHTTKPIEPTEHDSKIKTELIDFISVIKENFEQILLKYTRYTYPYKPDLQSDPIIYGIEYTYKCIIEDKIESIFIKLMDITTIGNSVSEILFLNLMSIILLDTLINIKIYYTYSKVDTQLINDNIGIKISCETIEQLLKRKKDDIFKESFIIECNHAMCFFKCNDTLKFYDGKSRIIDFNYNALFFKFNKLKDEKEFCVLLYDINGIYIILPNKHIKISFKNMYSEGPHSKFFTQVIETPNINLDEELSKCEGIIKYFSFYTKSNIDDIETYLINYNFKKLTPSEKIKFFSDKSKKILEMDKEYDILDFAFMNRINYEDIKEVIIKTPELANKKIDGNHPIFLALSYDRDDIAELLLSYIESYDIQTTYNLHLITNILDTKNRNLINAMFKNLDKINTDILKKIASKINDLILSKEFIEVKEILDLLPPSIKFKRDDIWLLYKIEDSDLKQQLLRFIDN